MSACTSIFCFVSDLNFCYFLSLQDFINMNFYQDHLYENFDVNLAGQSSACASAQELTMTETTPLAGATALS